MALDTASVAQGEPGEGYARRHVAMHQQLAQDESSSCLISANRSACAGSSYLPAAVQEPQKSSAISRPSASTKGSSLDARPAAENARLQLPEPSTAVPSARLQRGGSDSSEESLTSNRILPGRKGRDCPELSEPGGSGSASPNGRTEEEAVAAQQGPRREAIRGPEVRIKLACEADPEQDPGVNQSSAGGGGLRAWWACLLCGSSQPAAPGEHVDRKAGQPASSAKPGGSLGTAELSSVAVGMGGSPAEPRAAAAAAAPAPPTVAPRPDPDVSDLSFRHSLGPSSTVNDAPAAAWPLPSSSARPAICAPPASLGAVNLAAPNVVPSATTDSTTLMDNSNLPGPQGPPREEVVAATVAAPSAEPMGQLADLPLSAVISKIQQALGAEPQQQQQQQQRKRNPVWGAANRCPSPPPPPARRHSQGAYSTVCSPVAMYIGGGAACRFRASMPTSFWAGNGPDAGISRSFEAAARDRASPPTWSSRQPGVWKCGSSSSRSALSRSAAADTLPSLGPPLTASTSPTRGRALQPRRSAAPPQWRPGGRSSSPYGRFPDRALYGSLEAAAVGSQMGARRCKSAARPGCSASASLPTSPQLSSLAARVQATISILSPRGSSQQKQGAAESAAQRLQPAGFLPAAASGLADHSVREARAAASSSVCLQDLLKRMEGPEGGGPAGGGRVLLQPSASAPERQSCYAALQQHSSVQADERRTSVGASSASLRQPAAIPIVAAPAASQRTPAQPKGTSGRSPAAPGSPSPRLSSGKVFGLPPFLPSSPALSSQGRKVGSPLQAGHPSSSSQPLSARGMPKVKGSKAAALSPGLPSSASAAASPSPTAAKELPPVVGPSVSGSPRGSASVRSPRAALRASDGLSSSVPRSDPGRMLQDKLIVDWSRSSLQLYNQALDHFRHAIDLTYPSGGHLAGRESYPLSPSKQARAERLSPRLSALAERSADLARATVGSYSAIRDAEAAMMATPPSKAGPSWGGPAGAQGGPRETPGVPPAAVSEDSPRVAAAPVQHSYFSVVSKAAHKQPEGPGSDGSARMLSSRAVSSPAQPPLSKPATPGDKPGRSVDFSRVGLAEVGAGGRVVVDVMQEDLGGGSC